VILKGEPGCGKTHQARALKNDSRFTFFEGIDQISACLQSSARNRVLFIDEIDTYKPGTFDLFYGLIDGQNEVYQDAWHPINIGTLTILGTMNGTKHFGRYEHEIINQHALIIPVTPPSLECCQSILAQFFDNNDLSNQLISIYQSACTIAPLVGFSLRDLKAFAHRVHAGQPVPDAAESQFAYSMLKSQQRDKFITRVHQILSINIASINTTTRLMSQFGNFILTSSRLPFVQLIEKNCALRYRGSDIKWHILCEGNSGTSKSISVLMVLQYMGYTEAHADVRLCFSRINANASNFKEKMLEAARNGIVFVVEELNTISKENEKLLCTLLDGYNPVDQCDVTLGFMMIASQNSAANHANRELTSQPLSSRCHRIYLNDYTDQELVDIAQMRGIEAPKEFVAAYRKTEIQYPSVVNTRTLFVVVDGITHERNTSSLALSA
jgi:hypothetical protein